MVEFLISLAKICCHSLRKKIFLENPDEVVLAFLGDAERLRS